MLPAWGAPQGGSIERGSGDITRSAQRTTVRQDSRNLIVHWDSFNIAAGERVDFLQPSSRATALNRILDQHPSLIHGSINATGRVLLVNPSGIVFSPTAHVQVHSLIASSLDISDADFLAGRHHFAAGADRIPGRVVNRGLLQAATGGGVSLLGGSVANEGVIVADVGHVTLAAGRAMTMDFDGDGLLRFTVDEALLNNSDAAAAAVDNSGELRAAGGQVLLSGKAASRVFSNVVNNSGVVSAGAITRDGGVVRLVAGHADNSVLNTGRLDASSVEGQGGRVQIHAGGKAVASGDAALLARSGAGQGGAVQLTGKKVGLFDQARIDVSGGLGGGKAAVGGGLQGRDPALQNSELTLVAKGVQLRADALKQGDGGEIIVWSDGATRYQGSLSARGAGQGDGGFAEVSGRQRLDFLGVADLSGGAGAGAGAGAAGALLLDPANIEVAASSPDIDGALSAATKDITDAADLDAAADFSGADSKITASAVVGLLNKADLSLAASNTITISSAITTSSSAMGGLTLTANTVEIDASLNLRGSGSLTVNGNTSITRQGVGITTTGAQSYMGKMTMGNITITLSANNAGTLSTVQFGNTLTTGATSALTVDGNLDLDGAASVRILSVNGTSNIAADVSDASSQTYTGLVTLGANVKFTGNRGFFRAGVDGTTANRYGMELAFSGNTRLAGATLTGTYVDSLANMGSLTTSGGGNTFINTDITTVRGQRYQDAVTLGGTGGRTLTAKMGTTLAAVRFDSTVTGNGEALEIDGNLDLDGAATGLTSLSVTGTSNLGADVTSTGAQSYTGAVTLSGSGTRTLTANDGGTLAAVKFSGALAGGSKALTITGNLDLDGAATGLASLTVSGTSNLGADVTSTGAQSYTGAVTLSGTGDRSLTANDSGTLAAVKFSGALAGGSKALEVDGDLDLDAAATGLASLTVSGTSNLGADVTSTGAQSYAGAVTLSGTGTHTLTANDSGTLAAVKFSGALTGGSKALTITGNLDLGGAATGLASLAVSGTSSIAAGITTTAAQSYTGLVTLGATVKFAGTQGAFTAGVEGTGANKYGLELAFSADTTLDSALLGAFANVGSLATSGGGNTFINTDITTERGQRYEDTVTLGGTGDSRTLKGTEVQFGGAVTGSGKGLVVTGNLDLDAAAAGLASLSVSGTSNLGANVTSTGAQTYTGAATLSGTGDRTLTARMGTTLATVQFSGALTGGSKALSVDGNLNLGAAATGLASLMVEGTSSIAANLGTTGAQSYKREVTLGANVTFTGTQGTFTGGVEGTSTDKYGLELAFSGDTTLDSAWSNIGSLATSGGGNTFINTDITTERGQRYEDAVTLGGTGDRSLTAKKGNDLAVVQFGGALTGNSKALSVDGNLDLDGKATGLSSLSVTGTSNLGADVTSTGAQTYTGAVTLSGSGTRTLTAKMGATLAAVQFSNTLAGGGKALSVDGNLDLDAAATGLASLTVSGTSNLGADVTTTGAQTYTGAVTLSGMDRTLTAKMGATLAAVQFSNTLAGGGKALSVDGNLDLDGAATALTSLTVAGTSNLGADVTSTGAQTYTGAVTLSGTGDRSLTAKMGTTLAAVKFSGALAGGSKALSVDGNLDLGGAATGLASLSVSGTSSIAADITTTAAQSYTGKVTLGANVKFAGTQGAFTGGVEGTGANKYGLELAFSGDTMLDSTLLNSFANVGSLATSGGGSTFINTDITTARGQRYEDAVTLGGTEDSLTLTGTEVQFGGAVTGNSKGLVITGNLDLDAAAAGLASLSVSGASNLGANVTSTGAQTYTGAATLSGSGTRTLTAKMGATLAAVQFSGALTGGSKALSVDGNLSLGGAATGLASLMVEGTSSIAADLTTTGAQSYTGKVTLGANVTFTGAEGAFTGGVEGTSANKYGLELAFSGDTRLDSDWSNIGSLTTSGGGNTFIDTNISTDRDQRYRDAVTLGGTGTARVVTARNVDGFAVVRFDGAVTGNGKALSVSGNLDLNAEASGLTSLTVVGASNLGADVTTTGVQSYGGAATLSGSGDRSLTAKMGANRALVLFGGGLTGGGKALRVDGNLTLLIAGAPAAGLASLAVTGTSRLGHNVTTTGMQTYTGAVTLTGAGDRTLTANDSGVLATVQFADGLAGGSNALSVDGNLDLDDAATGLTSLMVSGTSNLGADVTSTGAQTYTGAATLSGTGTHTLTANDSGALAAVKFSGALAGGSKALSVDGNLDLGGAATALTSLTVSGTSSIAADITTTAAQSYTGKITLGANVKFAGTQGAFTGGVEGTGANEYGLEMSFSADTTLDSALFNSFANVGSLATSGGGNTFINTDITTARGQRYEDAVTLGGMGDSRTLKGTDVQFGAAVTGSGKGLVVTGNLDLDGAAAGLASLSVSGTSNLGADVTSTGAQTYTGAATLSGAGARRLTANDSGTLATVQFSGALTGGSKALEVDGNLGLGGAAAGLTSLMVEGTSSIAADLTTTGAQSYKGLVTLGANVTFTGTQGTFTGGVDGASTDKYGLELAFSSDTTLASAWSNIGSLATSGGGNTFINADITTERGQRYEDAVTLGGAGDRALTAKKGMTLAVVQFGSTVTGNSKALSVDGNLDLDGAATGLSSLSVTGASNLGDDVTSTGAQTYTGMVTLSGMGDRSLTAKMGTTLATVQLAAGLMGHGDALSVDGNLDLDAAATSLASLSVSGTSNLGGGTVLTTSGGQIYTGAVTLDAATVNLLALSTPAVQFVSTVTGMDGSQRLLVSGNLDLDGAATNLRELSVTGASTLAADVNAAEQDYTGTVTLDGTASSLTLTATEAQGVHFQNKMAALVGGGKALTITGNLELDGPAAGLASLTVSGASSIAADITTTGAQSYTGRVILDANVKFAGVQGTFTGGVEGTSANKYGLELAFSADTTLDSTLLGAFANVGSLATSGGGSTFINADITTERGQRYEDAVTLGGTGDSRTLTGTDVQFGGAVTGNNKTLVVTGNLDLDAAAMGLASLSVSGASNLGADVMSTGAQTYTGAATLSGTGARLLTAKMGTTLATVQFSGALTGGNKVLEVDGNLDLGAAAAGLTSLTVEGTSSIAADLTTTGAQGYKGLVTLGADVTFTGVQGAFTGGVDGTSANKYGLELAFSGDTTLDSAWSNIGSLTTSGGGATFINTDITTERGQRYRDTVTLGGSGDRSLTAKKGNDLAVVRFDGAVTGNSKALSVDGNLDLDAAAMGLASLSVTGTSNLGADVTTTGAQTYTGAVTLSGSGTHSLTAKMGATLAAVKFSSTLAGGSKALSVDGNLDLDGAATALTSLTVTGTSNLGADVTSTGAQTYTGAVTLSGTGTRTLEAKMGATLAAVKFSSTLAGGSKALSVDGNLDLDGTATALSSLSVTGASNLGADVTTTGAQTYTGAVTLSGTGTRTLEAKMGATLAAVKFSSTLAGGSKALSVDGDLDLDGTAAALTSLTVSGASNLGADVTTTGAQTYTGAVTLSGTDRSLTAKMGATLAAVKFSSTLAGGSKALSVDGDLDLDGAAAALTSLTVSGASNLGADVTSTGAQTYTGAVTLSGTGTHTLTAKMGATLAAVKFSSTLAGGSKALSVDGDLDLDGAATALTSLMVSGASNLAADVTSTGAQTYTGAVTLSGTGTHSLTAKTGTTLAEVQFSGALTGGSKALVVDGNLDLNGLATGLASLMVSGASDLAAGFVNVGTTGMQTYTGAVTLSGFGTVGLFSGGIPAGTPLSTVQFASTVTGTGQFLGLSGHLDLDGAVTGLAQLSVSGDSTLAADVTTTDTQEYKGTVTLDGTSAITLTGTEVKLGDTASALVGGAKALTVAGNLDLDGPAAGLASLSVSGKSNLGADVTSTGGQTYTGAVTLSGAGSRTLTAKMGATLAAVKFSGTLAGGSKALSVDGNLDLGGAATGLVSLTVEGTSAIADDLTTTGAQSYKGEVTLGANVTFTGTQGTFTGGVEGTSTDKYGLELAFSGDTTLASAWSNIGSLATSGGGKTFINTDLTTVRGQRYEDTVTLGGAGATRTLTASELQFGGAVTGSGKGLVVTGNLDLDAAVSGLVSLSVSGASNLGADVTSTDMQTYTGAVTLSGTGARTLTANDSGTLDTVQFAAGLAGGSKALSVDGNLDLDGAATGLASLSVSGTSNLGGNVTSTGAHTYTGAVTLSGSGARSLTAKMGATLAAVKFSGALAGGSKALSVDGNLDLDGAATGLASLSVSGTSNLAADVTTTGGQTYTGAATLSGSGTHTLTAKMGATLAAVKFASTLAGGSKALSVDGNLDLGGAATGLASLTVEGTSAIADDLTTTGAQSYKGEVTLGANVTFTGTQGIFTGGVEGTSTDKYGLELAFSGDTTLASAWSNIGSLATSGGGKTFINTDLTTVRGQRYEDAVTLGGAGAARTLTATEVQFGGAVAGNSKGLVVTGGLDLDGAATGLTSLSVSGASNLGADVTTTGGQTYTGAATLSGAGTTRTLTANDSGALAAVKFSGALAGGSKALSVDGNLDLGGAATGLASLTVEGTSAIADDLTTTGAQSYKGEVTLGANVTFTGTQGTFAGGVEGTSTDKYGLELAFSADTTLASAWSNIGSLATSGGGSTFINTDLTTIRGQRYADTVTLGGTGATRTLTASELQFGGAVTGSGKGLVVTGNLDLDAAVSGLVSLSVSGASNLGADVTSTDMQTYTGAVTLSGAGARTLTANDGGTLDTVQFAAGLTGGGKALSVDGNLDLGGAATGLASLMVEGTSAIASNLTTTGAQSYKGEVTLGANVTFTGAQGAFTGGVEGTSTNKYGLELAFSGDTTLASAWSNIGSLTTSGGGSTFINTDISTERGQRYEDAVTLGGAGASRTLTATEVQLGGLVTGNGKGLVVTGDLDLDAAASGLVSLSVSGAGNLGADVTSTGAQTYTGAVTLSGAGSRTLTAKTGTTLAAVQFADALAGGGKDLTVDGNLDLDGPASDLASLSVSGTSAIGVGVTTTGMQGYTGLVTLGANVTFTGAAGSFSAGLEGTAANKYGVELLFSGDTRLMSTQAGGIASLRNIGALTTGNGGRTLIHGSITTDRGQRYEDEVVLDGSAGATHTLTATELQFVTTVTGAGRGLVVAANLDLDGAASGLASLEQGAGFLAALAADVAAAGAQLYGSPVTVEGTVTLSAGSTEARDTVRFMDAVDAAPGGGTLVVAGDLELDGAIGASQPLETLTVQGLASLNGDIRTVQRQEYQDAVTIGADISLSSAAIAFDVTIDTMGRDFDVASLAAALEDPASTAPRAFAADLAGAGNALALSADDLTLSDDVSVRGLDLSASNRLNIAGDVTLHVAPDSLQLASTVAGGAESSLTIPGLQAEALRIGDGGLRLTDFDLFEGHLVVGGRLHPEGITPYYSTDSNTALVINTATLTLAQEFRSSGAVTFLAGEIFLEDPLEITAGGQIGLFASGNIGADDDASPAVTGPASPDVQGVIDASGISAAAVFNAPNLGEEPSVTFLAENTIVAANRIVLNLGGGEVDVAAGAETSLQFDLRSDIRDVRTSSLFEAFINFLSDQGGLTLTSVQTLTINPAVALLSISVIFVDVSLFEEELTLYGQIGTGIALALSQCEEQEDCAPNITEQELDGIINELAERVRLLQGELADASGREQERVERVLAGYQEELQKFSDYRAALQAFLLAAEEEDDFDEAALTGADLSPEEILARERKVKDAADILTTINVRAQWMESLKEDAETRERLRGKTGIDLTPDLLDRLIEATKKEIEFFENKLRQILGIVSDKAAAAPESGIAPAQQSALLPAPSPRTVSPAPPQAAALRPPARHALSAPLQARILHRALPDQGAAVTAIGAFDPFLFRRMPARFAAAGGGYGERSTVHYGPPLAWLPARDPLP